MVYGLIGDPVDHSLSPAIQNAAFRSARIDAVYVPFHVKHHDLRCAIQGLSALEVRGFNVMAPHKVHISRYLHKIEASARAVASVNTVANENGKLVGYSTDGPGAINALEEAGISPNGKSIVIFGAGGASRAIAHSLASRARSIKLLNRTVTKANQVTGRIRRTFNIEIASAPLSSKFTKTFVEHADIVVNASSMGMDGQNNVPVEANWLHSDQCVFDIVYKPVQTRLLELASLARATTITGLDMLVNQGACSFELWTRRKAPMIEMRHVIAQELLAMEHAKSS